ncbi:MAG: efflux RND transporter permease subunit [Oligosphaeraceae bacterium]|nr:efflux RND transporter permease subunit [Oligosphaeraceae bacterium]
MYKNIMQTLLKTPGLTVLGLLGIFLAGLFYYQNMPVDAFPDVSPVLVPVFAEAHGMAPEEVERLITYPVESVMNGLPGVQQIKSTSAFGLSVVYVYFDDDIDIYFARQLVAERLASVTPQLPPLDEPPSLGPISSGLGQIFIYYLTADPEQVDTEGLELATWLRDLNDRTIKYHLQNVRGVTDVLAMGGEVLQYQIDLDPHRLYQHRITLDDVAGAVTDHNRNAGGQFLLLGSEEHLVRGLGLLEDMEDIRNIPIRSADGLPLRIRDIAEVRHGNEIRRGVVTRNGQQEVISGIVLKLYGENTSAVIKRLYEKISSVKDILPAGVELVPYYEQAELVRNATGTVKTALWQGALLVLLVLALFLGNWRSALIVALSLPVCAFIAVIGMSWQGVSANLMSLGGLAVAIGMLGDGAIVMVENIYRYLGDPERQKSGKRRLVLAAARDVARPVAFSIMIIILVFLPLLTLEGYEGKMFAPMAWSMTAALAGSLLTALFIVPALAMLLLRPGRQPVNYLLKFCHAVYRPLLELACRLKYSVLVLALVLLLAAWAGLRHLGREFIPTLEEHSILVAVSMAPSISLQEAVRTIMRLEKLALSYPEVRETVSRIGRPETGSHPHPVNTAEIQLELLPLSQWRNFSNKAELVGALRQTLAEVPGVQFNFTQPIQNAFDELLSGVKTQLAIKVFGDDLQILRQKSAEIKDCIEDIPGLVDLSLEQSFGQPQVQLLADRDACARYGISINNLMEMVEMAVGGEVIDYLFLNTRKYGIRLRYQEDSRRDPAALQRLLLSGSDGQLIRLSEVAEIRQLTGPIQINRENNSRRWIVQANVQGRDIGSVVADIRTKVAENIILPPGYLVEYGGQFENQQRAMRRLSLIIPLVIAGVFTMLWLAFSSCRQACMIIVNVPLSLVGGVMGLLIMGQFLSVPAAVGFIALFGIAVQNGMVMVSTFNALQKRGLSLSDAVRQGAQQRLRPVLMTALTTILGLLPLLLSHGPGSEIQRPLAAVVVFGLSTSTMLTLFILPALFIIFGTDSTPKAAAAE